MYLASSVDGECLTLSHTASRSWFMNTFCSARRMHLDASWRRVICVDSDQPWGTWDKQRNLAGIFWEKDASSSTLIASSGHSKPGACTTISRLCPTSGVDHKSTYMTASAVKNMYRRKFCRLDPSLALRHLHVPLSREALFEELLGEELWAVF